MNKKTKEKTMKTRKVLALAGVTLLAAGVLAACSGGSGAKGEQTFAFTYETHPDNLNYLTTGKAATADITMMDCLKMINTGTLFPQWQRTGQFLRMA